MFDHFGKEISVGSRVVYPTRPGGKGPLQLGDGVVKEIQSALGEIDVETGNKVVRISRTDRVAVVAAA